MHCLFDLYPKLGCNKIKNKSFVIMNCYTVVLTKKVEKELKKVPTHIAIKLFEWIEAVVHEGLLEVRKVPEFHDEPLQGK
ncbi:hypothetical protein ACQUW5_00820 [Legionella sp. CNM-1927-20]|uniref:hypothetical protein n=1 Tax=Legionella sp. CNM-1927-20 TaxID=3422221 RepID=UPI00403B0BFF